MRKLSVLIFGSIIGVFGVSQLFGAYVVEFDPNDAIVPNRVTRATKESTPDAVKRQNVLVYSSPITNVPDTKRWTNYPGPDRVPNKHLKVIGNTVVEMSTAEKQAVDDAEADAIATADDAAINAEIDSTVLRALILAIKDQVPSLNVQQLRTDMKRHYRNLR